MQAFGERLKQARVAAGLSQRALAEQVNLSPMAISKYENSRMSPSSDVLLRLARALGVKVGYFNRPLQVSVVCPAFRKHSRLGKKRQGAIEGQIIETLERYLAVEEVFAPGQLPDFEMPEACKGSITCVEQAEDVADRLRQEWKLGEDPIANLCETLEDRGVKVILLEGIDDHFDGYSCWANGSIPVVASRVANDLPGDRQRFNLAHELGHLLLEDMITEGVDNEKVCHRFAASFLVPHTAVQQETGGDRDTIYFEELHSLKHKWGLSMSAWLRRLADRGIISQTEYEISMRTFSKRGWRQVEPGEQVKPEQTGRFERLVQRAVAEDIISVSRAADFLNRPLIEVRRELGWPSTGAEAV